MALTLNIIQMNLLLIYGKKVQIKNSSSGVFVTSLINVNSLVCGTVRGCNLGETAYIVSTTRNPSEVKDSDVFRESFINVAKEVRKNFGNPFMTITVQNVDIHYFIEIK